MSNCLKIPIRGMHCKSCAILIEDKISELPEVQSVHVNFRRQEADVYFNGAIDLNRLGDQVSAAGYEMGEIENKPWLSGKLSDYRDALISILVIFIIYMIARMTGFVQLVNFAGSGDPSSLAVVMLLGVTAGFSTCMALVGGLLLGISARHAEKHPSATTVQKFRPHIFFNLGRVASYFILGGAIGLLGQAFQFGGGILGGLTIAVGLVMIFLGLQLTDLSPRLSRISFTLPSALGRILGLKKQADKEYSHRGALVSGALTFFLPCGFTQAMQLFAMSSGSFISGALIMSVFALGTAPGLLSLGGLTSVVRGGFARKFYKFTGVVVIAFAVLTISNGYNLTGWKASLSNWASDQRPPASPNYQNFFNSLGSGGSIEDKTGETVEEGGVQIIKTTFLSVAEDISPNNFIVKNGQPVRMEVTVNENGRGCMSTIMIPGLYNTPVYLQQGKTITMEFTPERAGTYDIACAMGVPRGKLIVR